MNNGNGGVRQVKAAIIIAFFTLLMGEGVFNLHALWQIRERVAALEAKVDILIQRDVSLK